MKKVLLFFSVVIGQFATAQEYHHPFLESLDAANFTVSNTGISLTTDRNVEANKAAKLAEGHGALKMTIASATDKNLLIQRGTISLWYKHEGTGTSAFGSNKPLVFWSNGASSYSEGILFGLNSAGKIQVISYASSSYGATGQSTVDFPTTGWNHLVVSWYMGNSLSLKINAYLNGQKVIDIASPMYMLPATASSDIYFAGFNDSHSSSLYGSIDEIKVFTEQLADEHIMSLYMAERPTSCVVNIPDANFKNALLNHSPVIDTNNDGEIQCSEAEDFTGTLDVVNKGISNLTGIEAFTNITRLYCGDNQLTSLNVSANTALTHLRLGYNQIATLNLSTNTALTDLLCHRNQLTSLDLSTNTALLVLECYNNQLTGLNVSANTTLTNLSLGNNQVTTLDLSVNPALTYLSCTDNQLTSLNIANGNNTIITDLYLFSNPNLTCIQVDNVAYSNANWTNPGYFIKDVTASYNANCGLGLSGADKINQVSAYPNPTKGVIQLNGISDVQIFDMSGRLILEQNNTTTIDFSNQESGVYLLNSKTQNGIGTARIIKE